MRAAKTILVLLAIVATVGVGASARGAGAATGPSVSTSAMRSIPALAESTCPAPTYGAQFYAPTIPGGGKTVALTFDDGPGPSTPAIIKILRTFRVRATFFNIGESETRWPNEVVEEADDGFLVANHSWSHPVMTGLSTSAQAAELDMVISEQRRLVGSWPCAFRPPYGDYNDTTLALARARHMAVWMWSVDTEDWKAEGSGSSYWIHRIISLAESEGGALAHPVVLMHNQSIPMPATVAALPTVIQYFQRHGYTFVDLLGRTGPAGSCGSGPSEFAPSPFRALRPGSSLAPGASLVSPGGQYRLTMEHSGDLDLAVLGGRSIWASHTSGHPGSSLTMRANGDLVVASSNGRVLWQSGTAGHADARFEVRADGDLAVATAGSTLWSSLTTQSTLTPGERLEPGWYLESPNMACRLIMQPSGNLTLYSTRRQPLWQSATGDAPGTSAVLQRDGSFDLFSKTWQRIFTLGTAGNPGAVLTLARLSQVVVRSRSGSTLWSSG